MPSQAHEVHAPRDLRCPYCNAIAAQAINEPGRDVIVQCPNRRCGARFPIADAYKRLC